MRLKRGYFKSLRPKLVAAIDGRAAKDTVFREELFDKLHTFFSRYFCESGSIYFRHLPAFSKTYERVYSNGEDVALSWKTRMLYYVKSDVLVRSMPVKLEDQNRPTRTRLFYFDASEVEHKKNNERREFVFEFAEVKRTTEGNVVHFKVSYSQKGKTTNAGTIIKKAKYSPGTKVLLTEDDLQNAFRVFRRQTEVDFFINKDARGFLREQFDLWLYQYLFQEESIFEQKRLSQLQAIQQTACDIIDFIAQFEDELRRAWEKPKFARKVHYVVTLDKLPVTLLAKIATHQGARAQIEEWQELGMVNEQFSMAELSRGQGSLGFGANGPTNDDYRFLPLDTKHFKDLELEILDVFGDLDDALDGELAHSENWQALNTLQRRYKERIRCIQIDPPYNTGNNDFIYRDIYRHASWMSMMENRLAVSLSLMSSNGAFFVFIDDNEQHHLRMLMDMVFSEINFITNYVWKARSGKDHTAKYVSSNHELILCYAKNTGNLEFSKDTRVTEAGRYSDGSGTYSREQIRQWGTNDRRIDRPTMYYPVFVPNGNEVYPIKDNGEEGCWRVSQSRMQKMIAEEEIDYVFDEERKRWNIYAKKYVGKETKTAYNSILETFGTSANGTKEIKSFFSNKAFDTTKPVGLVKHLIHISNARKDNYVLDYFAGSGTTAHAVINLNREDDGNRKYVLVEMGDYFHTVLLPRIKKVVYSKDWRDGQPISREGVSHFLKYYTLEQYEETLKNSRYEDGEQFEIDSMKSPFEQYIFFGDDKLAHMVKPSNNGNLAINLHDLYPDVDIAESLSNILGKPIRRRTANTVTFTDGTTEPIDPATMTEKEKRHFISLIKPYLWWGE